MSDFLDRLVKADAPEAREVTVRGQTGTVYFRKLTAAERENIVKGMTVQHTPGSKGTLQIDLAANERQQQMLVLYTVCKEDGTPYFKKIDEVKKLDHHKLVALSEHAAVVNREDDEDEQAGED